MSATYTLEAAADLTNLVIDFFAAPGDKPTPINLTNHSYFNLAGHDAPRGILDNVLQINSTSFTETDSESIPTKSLINLSDCPAMSFSAPTRLETALTALGKFKGYTEEEIYATLHTNESACKGGPTSGAPLGFDDNYVLSGFTKANESDSNGEFR